MTVDARSAIPSWTVGDRLRKARLHAGLAIPDLASYLGVSNSLVSSFETGARQPRDAYLRGWAEMCRVPFEWLKLGMASSPRSPVGGHRGRRVTDQAKEDTASTSTSTSRDVLLTFCASMAA